MQILNYIFENNLKYQPKTLENFLMKINEMMFIEPSQEDSILKERIKLNDGPCCISAAKKKKQKDEDDDDYGEEEKDEFYEEEEEEENPFDIEPSEDDIVEDDFPDDEDDLFDEDDETYR